MNRNVRSTKKHQNQGLLGSRLADVEGATQFRRWIHWCHLLVPFVGAIVGCWCHSMVPSWSVGAIVAHNLIRTNPLNVFRFVGTFRVSMPNCVRSGRLRSGVQLWGVGCRVWGVGCRVWGLGGLGVTSRVWVEAR